jgi:hypothetical protein
MGVYFLLGMLLANSTEKGEVFLKVFLMFSLLLTIFLGTIFINATVAGN